jgi:septal ring factor EnvC (AmiA/AmiB activator)
MLCSQCQLQGIHQPHTVLLLQAAQIQLDRAAQDFRQLHQERQDLIRQWDEARDAMKSRDEAIQVSPGGCSSRVLVCFPGATSWC